MSELYDQVQDHEDRITNAEGNQSTDEDTITDHEDRMSSLEETAGQLQFPLSQDTIDMIKQLFPTGTVTLPGGTPNQAIIKDNSISPSSVIVIAVSAAGGTQGILSYAASSGQAIVESTSATDTSTVAYVLYS